MDDHPTQRTPNTFLFFHPLSALLSEDMEQLFPCRESVPQHDGKKSLVRGMVGQTQPALLILLVDDGPYPFRTVATRKSCFIAHAYISKSTRHRILITPFGRCETLLVWLFFMLTLGHMSTNHHETMEYRPATVHGMN